VNPCLEEDVIRILLVEPMSLLRCALSAVLSLEDDLDVAAELARIDEAILMAKAVRPNVAVIDIDVFAGGACDVVCDLEQALPDCAILVLANADSPGGLRSALETHVRGFVDKDTTPQRLVRYIRQMAAGERVIDPTIAVAALIALRNPLTPREREVLRVAALGIPGADIAGQLHLSVGTVRNYMSTILRKTGARNRLEAVRVAEEAGWL
jgi:two-component system response regulator DesR